VVAVALLAIRGGLRLDGGLQPRHLAQSLVREPQPVLQQDQRDSQNSS
jgi:hypothetical protein